jgi:PRTRC genetic system ThiF family protein
VKHRINPKLLERRIRVLVAGCGGNGSAVVSGLPYLHQALLAFGHPGGLHVTLVDPDVVSETNCVRQPFCEPEIGLPKAMVLMQRMNLFWRFDWNGLQARVADLSRHANFDIVFGCVDTRKARREIHSLVTDRSSRVLYWLDLGNNASSGQFMLGQPINAANSRKASGRLPTVAEIYQETIQPKLDDDSPSCSSIEALNRQEPFINQVLAFNALGLLAQLLRHGAVENRGGFCNLATGSVVPIAV